MLFDNPAWNFKTFLFSPGVKLTDEKQARNLNATDPNLKAFEERGGKLILYQGWSDAAIPAVNTINYCDTVVATMELRRAHSFLRLYVVPGMQHCENGPGAAAFGQDGSSDAQDPHTMFTSLFNNG